MGSGVPTGSSTVDVARGSCGVTGGWLGLGSGVAVSGSGEAVGPGGGVAVSGSGEAVGPGTVVSVGAITVAVAAPVGVAVGGNADKMLTKASWLPLSCRLSAPPVVGKSGDEVRPTTQAEADPSTARPEAESRPEPPK